MVIRISKGKKNSKTRGKLKFIRFKIIEAIRLDKKLRIEKHYLELKTM